MSETLLNVQDLHEACRYANSGAPGHPGDLLLTRATELVLHCRTTFQLPPDDVFIELASSQLFSDMLNELGYDDAGRLFRTVIPVGADCNCSSMDHDDELDRLCPIWIRTLVYYHPFLEHIPTRVFRENLSFLFDLWLDNEGDSSNRPDGTFNPRAHA